MDLLNKVMVIGNLTRDPELRETGSGKAVAELGLAVAQRGHGGSERSDGEGPGVPEPVFLDVVLWERNAENASRYLKKGSSILVEGRLRLDRWEDRESGRNRSKLKVDGERLRFLNLGAGRQERSAGPDESPARGSGPRTEEARGAVR